MYRRDFGVLILSIFALYWSLQHEGAYEYKEAFVYELPVARDAALRRHLPAPVVADLNGDGGKEVVIVTEELDVHLVSPKFASRFEGGFAPAILKGKKHVHSEVPVASAGDRTPIAMAAGHLEPPPIDFVHSPRKMVLVIVTRGWAVICLDHNLNVLWETSIHDRLPKHASTTEVRQDRTDV